MNLLVSSLLVSLLGLFPQKANLSERGFCESFLDNFKRVNSSALLKHDRIEVLNITTVQCAIFCLKNCLSFGYPISIKHCYFSNFSSIRASFKKSFWGYCEFKPGNRNVTKLTCILPEVISSPSQLHFAKTQKPIHQRRKRKSMKDLSDTKQHLISTKERLLEAVGMLKAMSKVIRLEVKNQKYVKKNLKNANQILRKVSERLKMKILELADERQRRMAISKQFTKMKMRMVEKTNELKNTITERNHLKAKLRMMQLLKNQHKKLGTEFKAKATQLTNLRGRLQEKVKRLERMKRELEASNGKLNKMQVVLAKSVKMVANCKAKNLEETKTKKMLIAKGKKYEEAVDALRKGIQVFKSDLKKNKNKTKRLRSANSKLQQKIIVQKKEMTRMENIISEKLSKTKAQLSDSLKTLKETTIKLVTEQEKVKKLTQSNKVISEKLTKDRERFAEEKTALEKRFNLQRKLLQTNVDDMQTLNEKFKKAMRSEEIMREKAAMATKKVENFKSFLDSRPKDMSVVLRNELESKINQLDQIKEKLRRQNLLVEKEARLKKSMKQQLQKAKVELIKVKSSLKRHLKVEATAKKKSKDLISRSENLKILVDKMKDNTEKLKSDLEQKSKAEEVLKKTKLTMSDVGHQLDKFKVMANMKTEENKVLQGENQQLKEELDEFKSRVTVLEKQLTQTGDQLRNVMNERKNIETSKNGTKTIGKCKDAGNKEKNTKESTFNISTGGKLKIKMPEVEKNQDGKEMKSKILMIPFSEKRGSRKDDGKKMEIEKEAKVVRKQSAKNETVTSKEIKGKSGENNNVKKIMMKKTNKKINPVKKFRRKRSSNKMKWFIKSRTENLRRQEEDNSVSHIRTTWLNKSKKWGPESERMKTLGVVGLKQIHSRVLNLKPVMKNGTNNPHGRNVQADTEDISLT